MVSWYPYINQSIRSVIPRGTPVVLLHDDVGRTFTIAKRNSVEKFTNHISPSTIERLVREAQQHAELKPWWASVRREDLRPDLILYKVERSCTTRCISILPPDGAGTFWHASTRQRWHFGYFLWSGHMFSWTYAHVPFGIHQPRSNTSGSMKHIFLPLPSMRPTATGTLSTFTRQTFKPYNFVKAASHCSGSLALMLSLSASGPCAR